jgi:hypothetical protein
MLYEDDDSDWRDVMAFFSGFRPFRTFHLKKAANIPQLPRDCPSPRNVIWYNRTMG